MEVGSTVTLITEADITVIHIMAAVATMVTIRIPNTVDVMRLMIQEVLEEVLVLTDGLQQQIEV